MKKVLLVTLCVAFLASCDFSGQSKKEVQSQNDSLRMELNARNAELDEIMGSFNDIQEGFKEINEAENRVNLNGNVIESQSQANKIK